MTKKEGRLQISITVTSHSLFVFLSQSVSKKVFGTRVMSSGSVPAMLAARIEIPKIQSHNARSVRPVRAWMYLRGAQAGDENHTHVDPSSAQKKGRGETPTGILGNSPLR